VIATNMLQGSVQHAEKYQKGTGHGLAGVSSNVLMAWVGFAVLGLWVYHEIAQKKFTVILTLSVIAQALSFVLLQVQISTNGSVAGISGKSMIMHAAKLCCRLATTLFLDGYLPTDKSGDFIYQACDIVSLLLVFHILFCTHVSRKDSYQAAEDTFEVRNLMLGAFVLAIFIHPGLNAWTPMDIVWTTHLYIDAVTMVPQLWMLSKAGGRVDGLTAHYVAATLLSSLLSFLFWFYAAPELAPKDHNGINIKGLAVNGAHIVQVLLLLDFGYFYAKACLQGQCCASTMQLNVAVLDV